MATQANLRRWCVLCCAETGAIYFSSSAFNTKMQVLSVRCTLCGKPFKKRVKYNVVLSLGELTVTPND